MDRELRRGRAGYDIVHVGDDAGHDDDHRVVTANGRDGLEHVVAHVTSRRALWTSTIGLSPVTVTVSASAPTFRSALMVAVNEPVSSIPSRLKVLNPVSVKVTV